MPDEPRLRGTARRRNSLYPLGEIPHSIITEIGRLIVHRLARMRNGGIDGHTDAGRVTGTAHDYSCEHNFVRADRQAAIERNEMSETYYSTNNEEFDYSELYEAADHIWNQSEHAVGDTATVYEADAVSYSASEMLPQLAEIMMEQANEKVGEYCETWSFTPEDERSLQDAVSEAVDAWAKAHDMVPTFYGVRNSRPVTIRFVNEDGECVRVEEADRQQPK